MTGGEAEPLLELAAVMRRLRAECPWKAAQTHRSLARHLLEETYETLEAIDGLDESRGVQVDRTSAGDTRAATEHLREELGDLLLQVYFHAAIAEQAGAFTLDDVARGITEKLYRRNPHVFGEDGHPVGGAPATPEAVNDAWQAIKAQEKSRTSVTDGLPAGLPALLYADQVLDRLARAGSAEVPRSDGRGGRSGDPAMREHDTAEAELGDRLLALVAEARTHGTDPEQALRDAVRRLLSRAEP